LFLDEALGEMGVESFLGHIEIEPFDGTHAHRLSELQQLVDEARQVHGWITVDPLERYIAYRQNVQTDGVRGDLIVGITRLKDEAFELMDNGGRLTQDPLVGVGASLEYVQIDIDAFATETPSAERQVLEEKIDELFTQANAGCVAGGASGTGNLYIALLLTNGENSRRIVDEALAGFAGAYTWHTFA